MGEAWNCRSGHERGLECLGLDQVIRRQHVGRLQMRDDGTVGDSAVSILTAQDSGCSAYNEEKSQLKSRSRTQPQLVTGLTALSAYLPQSASDIR